MNSRIRGNEAEEYVTQLLRDQGCTIHERNYRWRGGEIDIIMQQNEVISFVEVKMRQKNYFALSEIITAHKQKKIITTARKYISEHTHHDVVYRFDVALLEALDHGTYTTTYVPNAFTMPVE
jgi:putative endonuclease